ncbi:MAG: hypothetical protein GTO18_14810 [Anaerolineales bacterium]|nr:hypothetical protein [Anaerolineales bacterium]
MRRSNIFPKFPYVLLVVIAGLTTLFVASTASGAPVAQEKTILVTSTADAGPGTLRQALLEAVSGDTIRFDPSIFPLTNPATISLTNNPLPSITQVNLTIDATDAGVILDGSGMPGGSGLEIKSNGNVIKGLWILNFPDQGILIFESSENLIGGINASPGGPCTGDCNIINNKNFGVLIQGEGSTGNIVSGNYIGSDATGKVGMRSQNQGIGMIEGARNNFIGGDSDSERNLISGNLNAGVLISGGSTMNNTVRGNWIGLYVEGARQAFPSDLAISPTYRDDCTLYVATTTTGIHKSTDCGETWSETNNGLTHSKILQVEIPADAEDGNTLYALTTEGHLFISTNGAASWSLVSETLQGIDYPKIALSANYSADQTIYTSAEGWTTEELGGEPGVFKSSDGGVTWTRMVNGMSDSNVRSVVPSPDPTGKDTLFALTYSGIEVSTDGGSNWAKLDGPVDDVGDLALSPIYVRDQRIYVTTHSGPIYYSVDGGMSWIGAGSIGGDPRDLAISPDFASDRTLCLYSDEGGSYIFCSENGGDTWTQINPALAGHLEREGTRIAFSPTFSSDKTIFMISLAGMTRSLDGGATWEMFRGLHDLGNGVGISIENGANQNRVGPNNVLSNNNTGVAIRGPDTDNNVIFGNLVGTDPTGTFAQANSAGGIEISGGRNNLVGGSSEADRNVTSGNITAGVWLGFADTQNNTVIGNYIGTDITGTAAIGNGGEGGVVIIRGAQNNILGRDVDGERNVISGNKYDGVYIGDSGTVDNIVSGNYIGTDASGKAPMGNAGHGISVNSDAGPNVIGPGNTVAFNLDGVAVIGQATTGNRITQNSIYANNEVGITNSSGGNVELLPPVIVQVGSRLVEGTAQPSTTVEVFSGEEDDGRIFEGSTITDEIGIFSFAPPAGRFTGPNLTTTATDSEGNTSQFSSPEAPPAPVLTRELPGVVAPTQVSLEPEVAATNLVLALFCVFFFGLTSTLFNSILRDYRDEMAGSYNRFIPRQLAGGFEKLSFTKRRVTTMSWGRLAMMWLIVLLLTSLIESFLDPEIELLSPQRLGILITIFVSALIVSAFELASDFFTRRYWTPAARIQGKVQWIGIFIAIACVFLSRALEFKPGYLYGIVGAFILIPKLIDTPRSGKRAFIVLLTILLGAFIFWLGTLLLPTSLIDLEPVFLTIFLLGLQGVFFQLFPLNVTEGGDIWKWRRSVWFISFAVVFFCFYHFLLNPNASDVQALQQNGVQTLMILIVIFGITTLVLWLLFPFRLRHRRVNPS